MRENNTNGIPCKNYTKYLNTTPNLNPRGEWVSE